MTDFVHTWEGDGESVTFTWLGHTDLPPDRVYALAFTAGGQALLVTDPEWAPKGWLPGGGMEVDEDPETALQRELIEEANAVVDDLEYLGSQRADDSSGRVSVQAFYWCRVTLGEDFEPVHEVSQRLLVPVSSFLDVLFWGRADPKGAYVLRMALERERSR